MIKIIINLQIILKMKNLIYLILFNSCFIFAQDTINQLDSKGLKNGYWRGFYEETKNLRFEGQFKNGNEVGTFKFYDNTKKKNLISTRKFETNNVAYTIIYNGNFKVSEGKTINKKREGKYLTYHYTQTEVMTEEFYKNDLLHGLRKVFYKSGEIAEECMYENGKRHGLYKKYAENGKNISAVYAECYLSLNGRAAQLYFSPQLNLLEQKDGFAGITWLYPLQ